MTLEYRPLATPEFLENLSLYLQEFGLSVQIPESGENAFFVRGLPFGLTLYNLPDWGRSDWRVGFGGWAITSGTTLRFVRHRLSHVGLQDVVDCLARYNEDGLDVRTEAVSDWIRESLPADGYYFQDLDRQLAEFCAKVLIGQTTLGRTSAAQSKAKARFRALTGQYLNAFPVVRRVHTDEDTNELKFLQFTAAMGYPEDTPTGTEGYFRSAFVLHTHEAGNDGAPGIFNAWGEGPFRASVACTGKTTPGEWITLVPPRVVRMTPDGAVSLENPTVPLMIAAETPIGYNRKRTFREGNAWKQSRPLYDPAPITHGLRNGFEHIAGPYLDVRRTEAVLMIASGESLNVYTDDVTGELLNLDDILLTEDADVRTVEHPEWTFSPDQWTENAGRFFENGALKSGYRQFSDLVPATVIRGRNVFTGGTTIQGGSRADRHIVGKVLIDGTLKAMAKRLRCRILAVDRAGKEYPVQVIVSGLSIEDKKMPCIPLAAVAGRAGIGYWEEYDRPIHPDRRKREESESLDAWAARWPDLVKATYERLREQGEDPDGLCDIYLLEDDLSGNAPVRQHLGQALVGYCRLSRLFETEDSGTRSRTENAVPWQYTLRFLGNRQVEVSPDVERTLNGIAELYESLRPFGEEEREYEVLPSEELEFV